MTTNSKKEIKIATWNVNSVNVRLGQIQKYCQYHAPDILLLQEIKCQTPAFPYEAIEDFGYQAVAHGQKTYNGVAILSKYRISDVETIDFTDNAGDARYIEALINFDNSAIRVASAYIPNGSPVGSDRYNNKLKYYHKLKQHMVQSMQNSNYQDFFLIGGDFNVAPQNIDVYSPATMQECIGFHIDERNAFQELLSADFIDIWRHMNPNDQTFSWWDYRDRHSFANDRGMRIDHILTHASFADNIINSGIDEKYRTEIRPSDHVPVWCSIYV